jgi:curved DNA-binding protein CbpA
MFNLNLYNILEIETNSSDKEIKKAWKKLALKYHPDKNNNNNLTNDKFIKIKQAYDILSNKELKSQYDKELKYEIDLNIYNNNFYIYIKNNIKNIIDSTEIDKIIKLIIHKKIIINNLFEEINKYNNNFINKITDITITLDYDLIDIWLCNPKIIKYSRYTKNIFNELIIPIDYEQVYMNEGDNIVINNILYNGNLVVKINIINTFYNVEYYYVFENELYILVNNKRIINNKFEFIFLDGIKYKFNIIKLKKIYKKIGDVYLKRNFGLPEYKTNNISESKLNKSISIKDIESNIQYSNFYFIII